MDRLLFGVGGVVLLLTLAFLAAILVLVGNMPDLPKTKIDGQCLPLINTPELSCGPDQLLRYTTEKNEFYYLETKGKYEKGDKNDKGQMCADVSKAETFCKEEVNVYMYNIDLSQLIGLKAFVKKNRYDMRPAVRLVGDRTSNGGPHTSNAEFVPVRKWKDRKRLASAGGFQRFGVQIKNGRIVIPVSGIYEVYSYIQYREPCQDGIPIRNATDSIKQSIYKYDATTGNDVVLMSSIQPHKKSISPYTNMYDSYLVSLFKLRAGDELSIKVNRIDLLEFPEFNFFGTHFIERCDKTASA